MAEWGLPQGVIDSMALVVARDGSSLGTAGFGRHGDEGPIGEREVALGRLLAPHIQRSLAISRLSDVTASGVAFGTVIDRSAVAVILVARDRGVLHLNDAARAFLQDGVALTSRGNRLTAPEPAAARRLREAVERRAHDEAGLTASASGFPLRGCDRQVHAVHVLPLGRGAVRPGLAHPAVAAVLVSRPAVWPGGVADAVAAQFGLTPAEARVFGLVARGAAPAEAAAALGVAPSTLKTHLLHVSEGGSPPAIRPRAPRGEPRPASDGARRSGNPQRASKLKQLVRRS